MERLRTSSVQQFNRRLFLQSSGMSLGAIALGSLLDPDVKAAVVDTSPGASPMPRTVGGGLPELPHFPPKIKRVIYLFQSGAPSQMDLFDHKPHLRDKKGIELPASVRMGQRITTMTSGQKSFPVAPSIFKFCPARPASGTRG